MKFPKFPEDLVTFTEEILNGALHLLCSIILRNHQTVFNKKSHD